MNMNVSNLLDQELLIPEQQMQESFQRPMIEDSQIPQTKLYRTLNTSSLPVSAPLICTAPKTVKKKVTIRSPLYIIEEIRNWLPPDKQEYFRTFKQLGQFLDLPFSDARFSGDLAHNLLVRRIECGKKNEIWFSVREKPLRFSVEEFSLITGLYIGGGPSEEEIKAKLEEISASNKVTLKDQFWPLRRGGVRLEDIRQILVKLHAGNNRTKSMVKLAFVYLLEGFLMPSDPKKIVDHDVLHLANDLEFFDRLPWGGRCYQTLVQSLLGIDMVQKMDSVKGNQMSYSLHGCTWIFQVWAYEAMPMVGELLAERVVSPHTPRWFHWMTREKIKFNANLLESSELIVRPILRPSNEEEGQEYWKLAHPLEVDAVDNVIDQLVEFLWGDVELESGTVAEDSTLQPENQHGPNLSPPPSKLSGHEFMTPLSEHQELPVHELHAPSSPSDRPQHEFDAPSPPSEQVDPIRSKIDSIDARLKVIESLLIDRATEVKPQSSQTSRLSQVQVDEIIRSVVDSVDGRLKAIIASFDDRIKAHERSLESKLNAIQTVVENNHKLLVDKIDLVIDFLNPRHGSQQSSKRLEDDPQAIGTKPKQHEDHIKFANSEKNNSKDSILDVQVAVGKFHSEITTTEVENENRSLRPSEEEIIEQILRRKKSAGGVLCQLKARHGAQASHLPMKDVLGIVATLGKVDDDNLSRVFSEYLGMETMSGIVCKTYDGVRALEVYDSEGCINKSTGLHGLGASIGSALEGRFLAICLENLRPYGGDFVPNDPQRRLDLLKPRLSNGECPPGFLGFAVNMINVDRTNLFCVTSSGQGLRETLFYNLFSRLQVYETRMEMLQALPCISDGAVSLDGGMIRAAGVFSLGNQEDIDVKFPKSSASSSLGKSVIGSSELKRKKEKMVRESKHCSTMQRSSLKRRKKSFSSS